VPAVHGNGVKAALEFLGDVSGRAALPDESEDLLFSQRKRVMLHLILNSLPCCYIPIDMCLGCGQEAFGSGQRCIDIAWKTRTRGSRTRGDTQVYFRYIFSRSQDFTDSVTTIFVPG
jgi:hypothetical protein